MHRNRYTAGLFVTVISIVSAAGFAPGAARADQEKPAAKRELWKPEDFIYGETANQLRISPDAKWVVWVKSTADKEKDSRVSNLVLSSLTQNREIPLTRGTDAVLAAALVARWRMDRIS